MSILSPRFRDDGKAVLDLNPLQENNIAAVKSKLATGEYQYERVSCAVCQGSDFDTISEKDRYGFSMTVVACRQCGLVQTNPRMTQASYNRFYNTEYRNIYIGTEGPTEDFFRRQKFILGKKIFDFISLHTGLHSVKDKFVFEVGCGAGGILKFFQEKGSQVKGIDLGEEYIGYGRSQHGLDLEVGMLADFVGKLERKPDIIIYSHVLEHILDPVGQMNLLKSIMHPGTLLYIEVPGLRYLHRSYDNDLMLYLQNAHVYHFTKSSLANVMAVCGFDVIKSDEFVRAIFKISEQKKPLTMGEYPGILKYLARIELMKRILPVPPYVLRFRMKRGIYQLLVWCRLVPGIKNNPKWNY